MTTMTTGKTVTMACDYKRGTLRITETVYPRFGLKLLEYLHIMDGTRTYLTAASAGELVGLTAQELRNAVVTRLQEVTL